MNPPRMYTCSPSWNPLRPPSPYHPSGSFQWTSPEHPVSCIKPGLVICFIYDIIHVSMPFSQIIPPSPSPTDSKTLFYTSVSLLLSRIQGYCYQLSKFHIYALVYCIGVFLSGFPGDLEVKASAWIAGDLGLIPGSGRSPEEGKWQPTPVLLPGESLGGRTVVGYSPWVRKEWDTTERLHFHFFFFHFLAYLTV